MFQFNTLDEAIKQEIENWVSQTLPKLKAKIDKNKIGNTGELKDSLDAQFVMEQGKLSAKVFFEYVVHGKFQDMKRWNFTSLPDVESLKKWVLSVGVGKFDYIPAYQNANTFPNTDRAAARIAWGIATKWNMEGKVARKKRWQPLKTIYNTLPTIRDTIAQKIIEFGYQSIENALR